MTRSDVETLLNEFSTPSRKIFVYKQEFIPDHFITVEKNFKTDKQGALIKNDEGTEFLYVYKIMENESTITIPNFDEDLFFKLLSKEELVLNPSGHWYTDIKSYRTGGCSCGAWSTNNSNCHSFDCRKYIK